MPVRRSPSSATVKKASAFKLTYATMFQPPEEMHARYEQALEGVRSELGQDHGMLINGQDRFAPRKFEDRSPARQSTVLGLFQKGAPRDAEDAVAAARAAFPAWSGLPWKERVRILRKAAALLEARVYRIAAVVSLEAGKNRMEALGDAQETADLISYACDQMESNDGFIRRMGKDPLKGFSAENISVLRPHGVWAVISPFNFPAALAGGPVGAALLAGNCVVFKPSSDTPWTGRLLAECFRDAGVHEGALHFLTGSGSSVGEAVIQHPGLDGITFTGSYEVGMRIQRAFSAGARPRPAILEMGGKNPAIVTARANLDDAAAGITRSAFGLQGQKCSACSRIYVEKAVAPELAGRLEAAARALSIGDPTRREVVFGPVINRAAQENYWAFTQSLRDAGDLLTGGEVLVEGELADGFFCAPTLAVNIPLKHPLWREEMFLPIAMIHAVESFEEAMTLANDNSYGLTAGFYGSEDEAQRFFEEIEAGVTYANRPQGATTGAWPGFQPFGGWKASGSTGKNAGGLYYLPLYLREQIRTIIRRK